MIVASTGQQTLSSYNYEPLCHTRSCLVCHRDCGPPLVLIQDAFLAIILPLSLTIRTRLGHKTSLVCPVISVLRRRTTANGWHGFKSHPLGISRRRVVIVTNSCWCLRVTGSSLVPLKNCRIQRLMLVTFVETKSLHWHGLEVWRVGYQHTCHSRHLPDAQNYKIRPQ
ncbi:hypothetical protein TNCV_911341 [Trichonephila clavipes]|nr:hypothetical protein TNCV_911341 [Trichonephila clavipes]